MLDAWKRAEHYRDLAECRGLAVTSFSTQMRNRHWRMAETCSAYSSDHGRLQGRPPTPIGATSGSRYLNRNPNDRCGARITRWALSDRGG